jgi:hypothetical protein
MLISWRGKIRRLADVMKTLMTRTFPVPSLWIMRLAARLEIMVAADVTIEYIPPISVGRDSSPLITGHAAPKSPSGKPRLTKAM